MPLKLDTILARATSVDPDTDRDKVRRLVLETIAACGLEVNASTGEVYSPSPRPAPSLVPMQQRNARWSGTGRRRR